MIPVTVKIVPFIAVALFFSLAIGCEPAKVPVGNLSGTVMSNGESVGNCVVGIYNAATKRTVGGKADATGSYLVKDIPPGDYSVFLVQKTSNGAVSDPFDKRIPAKFRDRKTSGFEVEIKAGDNEMDLNMEF